MFRYWLSFVLTILLLVLSACARQAETPQISLVPEPTQPGITEEAPPAKFTPTTTAILEPSPTATASPPLPTREPYLSATPHGLPPSQEPKTTQTQEPSPPPAPTELPTGSGTPGTVSGEICYPGDELQAMTAYFEDIESFQLAVQRIPNNQSNYKLDLDPGQYIAYAYLNRLQAPGGLYSEAVRCGMTPGCTDHSPVVFEVEAGQTVSGIDLCDWTAPEQVPPNPAPFDPRLSGLVYQLYDVNYFRYDKEGEAQFLMSTPFDLRISPDGKRGVFRDDEQNDLFLVDFSSGEQFNLTNTPQIQETDYWWEPPLLGTFLFRALQEGEGVEPGYLGMLYAIDVDGSNLQDIESEHGPNYSSLSPDGQTLAYSGGEAGYLYNWGAGVSKFNPRAFNQDLPEDLFISSPSWSPDGKKIVWHLRGYFGEYYQNAFGIFEIEKKTLQLIHPYMGDGYGGYAQPAEWSPDGKWLALPVHDPDPRRSGVWLINAAQPGGEDFLGESTYDPVWSPAGNWLVYIHRDIYGGGEFSQVWVVKANNLEEKALMGESTFGPLWSPDGKWLVYQEDYENTGTNHVWLYNQNTGERQGTALAPRAWAVDW